MVGRTSDDSVLEQALHVVDGWSAAVGKTYAWCILVPDVHHQLRGVCPLLFLAPTEWAFDASYMLYGTLFMMAGAYALSRNAHVRGDFLYRAWPPRRQARLGSRSLFPLLLPRHDRVRLRRLRICGTVPHDERAFRGQPQRPDRMAVQMAHRSRRRPDGDPGHRRGDALRDLPARTANGRSRLHDVEELEKVMLEEAEQTEAGRNRHKAEAIGAAEGGTSDARSEQSRARRADARLVRRLHHVRLSHRLHADGARRVLRLLRDGRPGIPTAGAALVFGDDERRADLDPVVRLHGLHHRAREHPRPSVPLAAARGRPDSGLAGARDARHLRDLRHRDRHRRARWSR